MRWFRRSGLVMLAFLAVTLVALGCASSPDNRAIAAPSTLNLTSLRDSIIASIPPDSEFYSFDGDEQYVASGNFGIIKPFKNAYVGPVAHRKFLAKIHVDRNYRGLKGGVANYWVVVDTSAAGSGKFVSAWAVAGEPLKLRKLTIISPGHTNPHTRGRWQNNSQAVPWASCSPTTCCCEGSTCNDMRAWQY